VHVIKDFIGKKEDDYVTAEKNLYLRVDFNERKDF